MKNFLRKLHIGDSAAGDGASSPSAPPPPPTKKGGGTGIEHRHASGLSGWLSSVTGRPQHPPPPPPPPASAATTAAAAAPEVEEESALASSVEERRAAEEDEERARRESLKEEAEQERRREAEMEMEMEMEKEKREAELEDYHMQLALEMSVREDPEAMQIEVAKQISLGSCPIQSSPAEVVAFRYWVLSMSTPLPLSSRLDCFSYRDGISLVLCSCKLDVRAEMGSVIHMLAWSKVCCMMLSIMVMFF